MLARALRTVASVLSGGGTLSCHVCGLGGLSGDALRRHLQFHRQTHPNCPSPPRCPLCDVRLGRTPLACHLMQEHGPAQEREPPRVAARRAPDGPFLLVNEPAAISGGRPGYWLPAGRVDAGESR